MFKNKFKDENNEIEILNKDDVLINRNKTTIIEIMKAWNQGVAKGFMAMVDEKDIEVKEKTSIMLLDKILRHYQYGEFGGNYQAKMFKAMGVKQ